MKGPQSKTVDNQTDTNSMLQESLISINFLHDQIQYVAFPSISCDVLRVQSQELQTSYHKLYDILKQHQNEVNEIRAKRLVRTANPLALVAQKQPVYHPQNHPTYNSSIGSQQAATKNKGKAIVNCPPPTYDQEPKMVAKDDALSNEKDIDKLMDLISLSFKKIYKPANNNLITSSNTSRAHQENSLRINRCTGYDNKRKVNVVGAKENVELEAHYMYMAHIQEVTPDAANNSRPIFDTELLQKLIEIILFIINSRSTCYIRNLKENDLFTGSHGSDLYSITLQDTFTPNLICLMAKTTSSQSWLWHCRLSYLNFNTINLLSKYDIVTGIPKLKFIKDHFCSSCELGKSKPLIPIDGQALTRMKNLRILKICFSKVEGRWQPFEVNFSGRLDSLSNKLSHIKHLWTTPKCFMRLKFMKLRYCCYLTSTPDFSEITNLEELTLECCENLVKVHPSIGSLKKLVVLNMRNCKRLKSFPSKLEMVSLQILILSGCLKREKLPKDLGRIKSLTELHIDRTSITEFSLFGQQERSMINASSYLNNCLKLFTNLAIDSQLSISETSQGSTNRFSSFLRYAGIQNNICKSFRLPGSSIENMDIIYEGNSIPEWFTNKNVGMHVKVELPSDWCFSKFRGYGTCVVFKRKRPCEFIGYSVKNFNGTYLDGCFPYFLETYFKGKPFRNNESYMIWLHYTGNAEEWNEANNFVTVSFEENNEDIEVKECGVTRLICDGDPQQEDTNLTM
nr:NB-ARC domains-containing protein [Tanacetum cinerariifolium]